MPAPGSRPGPPTCTRRTGSGSRPADATLVAVHPWDIDGAARAGLRTAWINRTGALYPAHLTAPDRTVATVAELA